VHTFKAIQLIELEVMEGELIVGLFVLRENAYDESVTVELVVKVAFIEIAYVE
jgi:hypothetical protein